MKMESLPDFRSVPFRVPFHGTERNAFSWNGTERNAKFCRENGNTAGFSERSVPRSVPWNGTERKKAFRNSAGFSERSVPRSVPMERNGTLLPGTPPLPGIYEFCGTPVPEDTTKILKIENRL